MFYPTADRHPIIAELISSPLSKTKFKPMTAVVISRRQLSAIVKHLAKHATEILENETPPITELAEIPKVK